VRYQDGPHSPRRRLPPNGAAVCQVILASQAAAVPFTAVSNGPDRPWTTPARLDRRRSLPLQVTILLDPASFGSRESAQGVTIRDRSPGRLPAVQEAPVVLVGEQHWVRPSAAPSVRRRSRSPLRECPGWGSSPSSGRSWVVAWDHSRRWCRPHGPAGTTARSPPGPRAAPPGPRSRPGGACPWGTTSRHRPAGGPGRSRPRRPGHGARRSRRRPGRPIRSRPIAWLGRARQPGRWPPRTAPSPRSRPPRRSQ
jgi:hypothetical protein